VPTGVRLAEHTHLVAIDLPGFGHSRRRDELLSPRAMGEFVVRAADSFGLDRPHVVGPDIGTAAALFAAALHPGRLRSLVVGSGGAAVPLHLRLHESGRHRGPHEAQDLFAIARRPGTQRAAHGLNRRQRDRLHITVGTRDREPPPVLVHTSPPFPCWSTSKVFLG
jgi:pimeloyl-ACP methyl ester carboxylesterase